MISESKMNDATTWERPGEAKNFRAQKKNVIAGISLLTAGRDKHYAVGLACALAEAGISLDFVGSDEADTPELRAQPEIHFLNLRGDQRIDAGLVKKILRVLAYYWRLLAYAAGSKPKVFHILWNNKFELFDRTWLMLYYRLLGKKIVFTAHNVNAGERDANDTFLNRLTLKIQYRLLDHIFVHTRRMKTELALQFGIAENKITVIPYGINNMVPNTELTGLAARQRLGLEPAEKVILFLGNIAPYKGVETLADAFELIAKAGENFRLIIAGRPKGEEVYWNNLLERINRSPARAKMILKIEYVPDAEMEVYFKAADVLVLPYKHIFQSGVLFLGYSFGLPVIASDVGSLKEEILEGRTGFIFQPNEVADLVRALNQFFAGDLYQNLAARRPEIQKFASDRHSWGEVAAISGTVYSNLISH
jgi:D-inositol-3-phosphate glycosyltransferase